jgi:hypothetical protein
VSYRSTRIGVAARGYTNGKFLDINYQTAAKQIGFSINKVSGDDLRTFPIERARTRFAFYLVAICTVLRVGYGWALEQRIHVGVPLRLQFLLGFITTCTVQTFHAILVDIFPANPSTAAASGNLNRCTLSANDVAAMQPLLNQLGKGWFFTVVGLISGITSVGVTLGTRRRGIIWRNARPAYPRRICGFRNSRQCHRELTQDSHVPGRLTKIGHLLESVFSESFSSSAAPVQATLHHGQFSFFGEDDTSLRGH